MCGIAGCISEDITEVSPKAFDQMRQSIRYRGQDDSGEWTDEQQVHFLHTRLSIIDLNSGQQPMWDRDSRYVIIYNGEIYNYKELKKDLQSLGAKFHTESDTEVILEGYKSFGTKIFEKLNGMFALAIWDTVEKRLVLATDHLGKKPLFWCKIDGNLYFASTLEAFRAIPGWTGRLSVPSTYRFLLLGNSLGENSIYEQAFAVPQASFAIIDSDTRDPKFEQYWKMDFSTKSVMNFSALMDEYEELLTDAIRIRLRSDVPLANTFSAGVDSGTIAAIAKKKLNISLACYTIDYHTAEDPSEETLVSKEVSRILDLNWTYIHFDYHQDLLDELSRSYHYYDEPSPQVPLVYSYRLYEKIRPYAKVVLSGNGADELFTGYIGDEKVRQRDLLYRPLRFLLAPVLSRKKISISSRLVGSANRLVRQASYLGQKTIPDMLLVSMKDDLHNYQVSSLLEEAVIAPLEEFVKAAKDNGVARFLDLNMFAALTYGTRDSNYRVPDISGLAAQVEVRSPFLDYRLVEFAARLPHRYKIGNSFSKTNKYLPRKYYERYVPHRIAWGPKRGMAANLRWDQSIISDQNYHDRFSKAYKGIEEIGINAAPVEKEWEAFKNGKPSKASVMMRGFMLGEWLDLQKKSTKVETINVENS